MEDGFLPVLYSLDSDWLCLVRNASDDDSVGVELYPSTVRTSDIQRRIIGGLNLCHEVVATLLFYSPAKLRVACNVFQFPADFLTEVINSDSFLKVGGGLSTK